MIKHLILKFAPLAVFVCACGRIEAQASDPLSLQKTPTRVACIGDSITYGSMLADPEFQSYPAQLQRILGKDWDVRNFGVSGRTLLNAGDYPYQKEKVFVDALKFNPNVVVIMLGTNDTKPQNWKFKDQFAADYKALIEKIRAIESKPHIFICHPLPVLGPGNYGINEAGVEEEIPMIDAVAKEERVDVIDMHGALAGHEEMLPERVHPNEKGDSIIAKTAYKALTGKEFAGEVPDVGYSVWHGYERSDFMVDGRGCLLISPKTPKAGNPWIWRMEFFGAFPQADLALLDKGYYVAYMDVQNMYGAPLALDHLDKFYAYVESQYHLAPRVVPEGFSRGGLFALNWAERNPDKVAALYLDAPVCDFKSWPGGKGHGDGSPSDWENVKRVYKLTDEQALTYPTPLDNLKPLAAAKIAILCVCGDADTTVPVAENTAILEQRYKDLGGEIKVILKPGVKHHPHSLTDPTPIVDFILTHG
jgi:lysophospholipase L1-like esterase